MPLYVYQYLGADGQPDGKTFEVFQKMADAHLKTCPTTGRVCRRAIVAPSIGNLTFTDTTGESRMHYFHPGEVDYFRQELKTNAIKDDGRVVFEDRQDQQKFQKAYDAYENKVNPNKKPVPVYRKNKHKKRA